MLDLELTGDGQRARGLKTKDVRREPPPYAADRWKDRDRWIRDDLAEHHGRERPAEHDVDERAAFAVDADLPDDDRIRVAHTRDEGEKNQRNRSIPGHDAMKRAR